LLLFVGFGFGGLDDDRVLNFDQARPGEFAKLGQDFFDLFSGLNEFNLHRQVGSESLSARRVEMMVGAEASNASHDTRARYTVIKEEIQYGGVNGLAAIVMILADVDAHFFSRARFQH